MLIGIAAGQKGKAQIFDLHGKAQGPSLPHDEPVLAVCFRHDGKIALTGTEAGKVTLWDVALSKPIEPQFFHTGPIRALAFGPDGKTIAVASDAKDKATEVRIWSLETNQPIGEPLRQPGRITALSFADDGAVLRTRDAQNVWHTWGVGGRQPIPFGSDPRIVAENGKSALAMGEGRTLRLLSGQPTTAKSLLRLRPGEAKAAAFSPDGKLLLTGTGDGLRLWDVGTGERIGTVLPFAEIRGVAWSPSGRHFLAWNDNQARVWSLPEIDSVNEDMSKWLQMHLGLERAADGSLRWLSATERREKLR
jgi:WD40 repeat protein